MSERQETIGDIVAEMRNLGKLDEKSTDKIPRSLMGLGLRTYADRIEAAWKRECDFPKSQSVDADKLTGKDINGVIDDLLKSSKYYYHRGDIVQGQFCRVTADRLEAAAKRELGNAAAMREALEAFVEYSELVCRMGMFNRDRLVAITTKARDALSAPPRNCDVLSADQFKKIWEHEMRIYMPKEATDRDRNNARIVAYGVIDALFAEEKGENNGK